MDDFNKYQEHPNYDTGIDPQDYYRLREKWYNSTQGKLTGYNCEKCLNRGYFLRVDENGFDFQRECECMKIRKNFTAIQSSGLEETVKQYTFKNFTTEGEWQKSMKKKAHDFLNSDCNAWMIISGISGCGKTHLCTAVSTQLMVKGRIVKYMLWRDIHHKMMSSQYNDNQRKEIIDEIKSADVLYIDDFLKTTIKGDEPTEPPLAEIKNAYDVINIRYLANKKTIISSELMIDEIYKFDAAVGGRIKQKAQGYIIQIKRDEARNYRTKER